MKHVKPLVSIVIVNYNTYKLTCDCVKSIKEKTIGSRYEVIIVDNQSTETTSAKFEDVFPDVKVIYSAENLGFSKGNNLGISTAKGEIILLLNSDTELVNDAVTICAQLLMARKKVAVVGAKLLYPNGVVQHNCQNFPSVRSLLFELFRLPKIVSTRRAALVLLGSFFDHSYPISPDWIWGTFFMFRKESLARLPLGKLDESFFMYCEDMEWCKQFRKLGMEVSFVPDAQVIHYSGMSKGRKTEAIKKNRQIFLERHYSLLHRRAIVLLERLLMLSLKRWR